MPRVRADSHATHASPVHPKRIRMRCGVENGFASIHTVLACPAPGLSCCSWVQVPPALGVGLMVRSLPSPAPAFPLAGRSTSGLDPHERPIVLHSSAPIVPPLSSTPRAARSTRREPEHGAAPTMHA